MRILKLGTRGSPLAVTQAGWVRDRLMAASPGVTIELEIIKTTGDRIQDRPLREVGGKAVFLKEIEEALVDGRVDLAVHSLKDVPAFLPEGLELAAYPEREDPRDVLLAAPGLEPDLDLLPEGGRVGTSSLRRAAQVLAHRPDLEVVGLRGNVGTRLSRLEAREMEATLLALSGLKRLDMVEEAGGRAVPADVMVPAIGQGALAIEVRSDDGEVRDIAARLDHLETRHAVTAERGLLERLEGDCKVPIGGHAVVEGDAVHLVGLVARPDGSAVVRRDTRGPVSEARALGLALAERMLADGAREILAELQVEP